MFITAVCVLFLRSRSNSKDFKIWDATTSRTRWLIKDWTRADKGWAVKRALRSSFNV